MGGDCEARWGAAGLAPGPQPASLLFTGWWLHSGLLGRGLGALPLIQAPCPCCTAHSEAVELLTCSCLPPFNSLSARADAKGSRTPGGGRDWFERDAAMFPATGTRAPSQLYGIRSHRPQLPSHKPDSWLPATQFPAPHVRLRPFTLLPGQRRQPDVHLPRPSHPPAPQLRWALLCV